MSCMPRGCMKTLGIYHRTTYPCWEHAHLSAHKMMLRPRTTRRLQLISHDVNISADAEIIWAG